jgi:hypothetical protein
VRAIFLIHYGNVCHKHTRMQIFTEDGCDERRELDRDKVLNYLQKEQPAAVVPYLVGVLDKVNYENQFVIYRNSPSSNCRRHRREYMTHSPNRMYDV